LVPYSSNHRCRLAMGWPSDQSCCQQGQGCSPIATLRRCPRREGPPLRAGTPPSGRTTCLWPIRCSPRGPGTNGPRSWDSYTFVSLSCSRPRRISMRHSGHEASWPWWESTSARSVCCLRCIPQRAVQVRQSHSRSSET
jgi:hypothetical protein